MLAALSARAAAVCAPAGEPTAVPREPGFLLQGDHLDALSALLEEWRGRVDLVYLDPPFGTGTRRRGTGAAGVKAGFGDPGAGAAVLDHLLALLAGVHALLAPQGSLVLHCDWRLGPALSLLCDEVFGPGARRGAAEPGFRNEIVWLYGLGGSSPRWYPRKHDVLLWYTRGASWYFEPPRVAATSQRMAGQTKKCPDWWDIPALNNMARERVGYPTQKPLALLERVVAAHAPVGGVVADLTAGSGTTLVAAERLGRRWIGCDAVTAAIELAVRRLGEAGVERVPVLCVAGSARQDSNL